MKNVVVIFGGQSSEHEVSCMSVMNIAKNIDPEKYNTLLVGITKEGHWLWVDSLDDIPSGKWRDSEIEAIISPDATKKCLMLSTGENFHVDVVYLALHGTNGEDGTIQGLMELAKIPYIGCGVLSSAITMDKHYTKLIVDTIGTVNQAAYVLCYSDELSEKENAYCDEVESKLGYPVFIKPSSGGSSCGVSRADNREELKAGLKEAAKFDKKILVEEMIKGREIECAVLGKTKGVKASGVGEILAAAEFYDYDAKYNNAESKTVTDPDLPEEIVETIRKNAQDIFEAVNGYGLSRVDFFVTEDGRVVFNEINTLPGFTNISMYPMLWNARGINGKELVTRIIELAQERYN